MEDYDDRFNDRGSTEEVRMDDVEMVARPIRICEAEPRERKSGIHDHGTSEQIAQVCDAMKDLLLYKNKQYGNSAFEPFGLFFKGNAGEGIKIRLDDKLMRIKHNNGALRLNDICDTIGYLFLLLVSYGFNEEDIEKLKD